MLASCGTPSGPHPKAPPPAEAPKPAACPPELQADVKDLPAMPTGASIVAPATVEEQLATSLHLSWVQDVLAYGREYRDRAKVAKRECEKR